MIVNGKKNGIAWTDQTWNPVTGCHKVSAGCEHCYAAEVAARFWGDRKFTDIRLHEGRFKELKKLKTPSKIFVNSMSDLFHKEVPNEFILQVYQTMAAYPQHTFQILTKRIDRAAEWYKWFEETQLPRAVKGYFGSEWPLKNVWIGPSVENHMAETRYESMLKIPAVVHILSVEPMIGPLVWLDDYFAATSRRWLKTWVIVGGESGKGCRPMELKWATDVRNICEKYGAPFFMKQLGGERDHRSQLTDFPDILKVRMFPGDKWPS